MALTCEQTRDPDGNPIDWRDEHNGHLMSATLGGKEKPKRADLQLADP